MYYFEVKTKGRVNSKVKKLGYTLQDLTKFLSFLWEAKLKITHYDFFVCPYMISLLHFSKLTHITCILALALHYHFQIAIYKFRQ